MTRPSITCPKCGRVSHHPKDVEERYCGNCHQWHELMALQALSEVVQTLLADERMEPPQ